MIAERSRAPSPASSQRQWQGLPPRARAAALAVLYLIQLPLSRPIGRRLGRRQQEREELTAAPRAESTRRTS